ncbi:MAG: hypothetical protein JO283_11655 [Bradyrhizobium sp.]|nr:hypothetical protein [Bradyrhizobium sp.]
MLTAAADWLRSPQQVKGCPSDERAWVDKPCIERFLSFLSKGTGAIDLGCGGRAPVPLHMAAHGFHITGALQ